MNNKVVIAIVGVIATGVGFAGGYFVGTSIMKKKTDEFIDQLNNEVNDLTDKLRSKELYSATDDIYKEAYINSLTPAEKEVYDQAPNKERWVNAHEKTKQNKALKREYFEKVRPYVSEEKEIDYTNEEEVKKVVDSDDFLDGTADDFDKLTDENGERDENFVSHAESGIDISEDGFTEGSYDGNRPPAMGGEDAEEWTGEARIYRPLPPYIIDETDFNDSQFQYFDKVQFTYFSDGTLIDDGDSIVPNPGDIIGFDNLSELDREDTGVILVRNEETQTDYEVEYKEMTYSEFMGDI